MPALELVSGTDPCSLLNNTDYPTLWPSTPDNIETLYDNIFKSRGVLKLYVEYLTELKTISDGLNKNILKSPNDTSTVSLIQFLSNGSLAQTSFPKNPVASTTGIDYSKLGNVILRTEANVFGIVDSYIVGSRALNKTTYANSYSTESNPLLTDKDLWDANDAPDEIFIATPKSILGALLKDGFLMTSRELFSPEEFNPTSNYRPADGAESLIFLYRLAQKGTGNLTQQQQNRKSYLETKNLRFFGAFLAEYCFYRKRYEILLNQYFKIYSQPTSGATRYTSPTGELKLLSTSTATPVSQQDYLKDLAFQLAILNTRLADLRRLLGKISFYYNSVYIKIQKTINDDNSVGSNKDLVNRITALNDSAKSAQKYLSDMDFHQGVMEYNAEKNRYGNILLAFYAFLNIAAVAAILQINQS